MNDGVVAYRAFGGAEAMRCFSVSAKLKPHAGLIREEEIA